MKAVNKAAVKFTLSWIVLIALLFSLHYYANHIVETQLEAPHIQAEELEDGTVSLSWNAVEYASSYRIFWRPVNGGWSLVKAVPADTLSYNAQVDFDGPVEYSVRACNASGGRTTLSPYSAPTQKVGG